MNKTRAWLVAGCLLLALGTAMRLLGALLFSASYSMDHSVPCLMAKHIAEGRALPVFYYGQPYMGSIESFVGALFFKLPINGNLACNLGTALFGILLLPVVWLWGRRSGGPGAGIAALALLVVGPPVYMQFMNWSYGGYAAVTFFQAVLLLAAVAIVEREKNTAGAPAWLWGAMGLAAGLGWWTSPMIIPGLMCVAVLFLFNLGPRCFQRRMFWAAAAFLLGSLPLWLWNIRHHFETITYLRGGADGSYLLGMARYVSALVQAYADRGSAGALLTGLAVLLVLAACTFILMRRPRREGARIYLAAAWMLPLVALFFFAGKPERIGPSRYILPIIPALAVLAGNAVALLNRKTRGGTGSLLLALLLLPQALFVPACFRWYGDRHELFTELDAMKPCLDAVGTDGIYAYYNHRTRGYGLNFYFNEAYCFADLAGYERQPSYLRQLELADSPAFLNNFRDILGFVQQTGGRAEMMTCSRDCHLTSGLAPRDLALRPILSGFTITDGATGLDATRQLTSGHRPLYWMSSRKPDGKTLVIQFDEPTPLALVRLLFTEHYQPLSVRMECRKPGEAGWEHLSDNLFFTTWYWSGPRPYPGGSFYRQDMALPGEPVSALRLTFNDDAPEQYAQISEIRLFTSGSPNPQALSAPAGVEPLAAFLDARRITRIYADRWEANQLYQLLPPETRLSLEASVFEEEPRRLPPEMELASGPAAVIAREENAVWLRDVLSRAGALFEEHDIPPWRVFVTRPAAQDAHTAAPLVWRGCAVQLQELPEAAGTSNIPVQSVNVRFKNGIVLAGLGIGDQAVAPGDSVEMLWHWIIPEDTEITAWAVFAHVTDASGEVRFQGDRVLCENRMETSRLNRREWLERVILPVPPSTPPGEYELVIGLYEANPPHKRVPIASSRLFGKLTKEFVPPMRLKILDMHPSPD